MEEAVKSAVDIITRSYTVVFTGSGISAEAGIPTFRGKDGLWNKYRPEELATPQAFNRDPLRVWEWYAWRIGIILRAKPTVAHKVIAELERKGIVKAVITQNVDGLHQRAGSRNVIELHGSIMRVRCTSCGHTWVIGREPKKEELPLRCPRCGSVSRPDVVWFGESLPREALSRAYEHFSKAEAVIVVGTSGVVEPAASLVLLAYERGAKIININLEANRYMEYATVNYIGPSSKFFCLLAERMGISIDE